MKALMFALFVWTSIPALADDNEAFLIKVNAAKARCFGNGICLESIRQVVVERENTIKSCNKRKTFDCPQLKDFADKLVRSLAANLTN